jgi:branched-chain amino acid transport system substrate-binding protein
MTSETSRIPRRAVLSGAAALTAVATLPARAQAPPVKLGTLTPLTGAGGSYGPSMRKSMAWVVE